jgi:hypothetical protein
MTYCFRIDPPPGYSLSGQPLADRHPHSSESFEQHDEPYRGQDGNLTAAFPTDERALGNNNNKLKRGRKTDPDKSGALKNATSVQRPRTSYSLFAHQVSQSSVT